MQDERETKDRLLAILTCLESEYEKVKAELYYEEKLNRVLHDQAKKQRFDMFLSKNDKDDQCKTHFLEAVKRNHLRMKQLESALAEKDLFHQVLDKVNRKVSKSIPSKLEKTIGIVTELREKVHAKHLKFEAQRNRSLQRVKEAITEQQAMSVLNQSLSSFKSLSNLSISNASSASIKNTSIKKAKFSVVSKSKKGSEMIEESTEHHLLNFKKQKEPAYPRLKLFQYEPLPKNS